jgi:hypothetical protein
MTAETQRLIQSRFNDLYTDLRMLQDGEWMPDHHSVQDSIDNLESLAVEVGASQPVDLRDEEELS